MTHKFKGVNITFEHYFQIRIPCVCGFLFPRLINIYINKHVHNSYICLMLSSRTVGVRCVTVMTTRRWQELSDYRLTHNPTESSHVTALLKVHRGVNTHTAAADSYTRYPVVHMVEMIHYCAPTLTHGCSRSNTWWNKGQYGKNRQQTEMAWHPPTVHPLTLRTTYIKHTLSHNPSHIKSHFKQDSFNVCVAYESLALHCKDSPLHHTLPFHCFFIDKLQFHILNCVAKWLYFLNTFILFCFVLKSSTEFKSTHCTVWQPSCWVKLWLCWVFIWPSGVLSMALTVAPAIMCVCSHLRGLTDLKPYFGFFSTFFIFAIFSHQ